MGQCVCRHEGAGPRAIQRIELMSLANQGGQNRQMVRTDRPRRPNPNRTDPDSWMWKQGRHVTIPNSRLGGRHEPANLEKDAADVSCCHHHLYG